MLRAGNQASCEHTRLPGSTSSRELRRGRLWLFRALSLLLVAIVVVCCDWAARCVFDRIPTTLPGKQWVEYARGRLKEEETRQIVHPFLAYQNRPGWRGQVNSAGYRGPELQSPEVLCLGGSTTWGLFADRYQDTWPFVLGGLLHREVANGGVCGYTSAEILASYSFRYRYLGSKLAVLHVGVNDSLPLFCKSYDTEYSRFRVNEIHCASAPRPGEAWLLDHSGIAQLGYSLWIASYAPMPCPGWQLEWKNTPHDLALKRVREREPVAFRRNLDLLLRNLQADGAKVLLVKEPCASPERTKECTQATVCNVFDVLLLALSKNAAVMDSLGQKYSVPVISINVPDRYYVDFCHVGPEGERFKAQAIAQAIRRHRLLETPQRIAATGPANAGTGLPFAGLR